MDRMPFSCQVCLTSFRKISCFKKHLCSGLHGKKMQEIFQHDQSIVYGIFPRIAVMGLLAKQHNRPIVGLSLLTLCFNTNTLHHFYLCHVCEEKCPSYRVAAHLYSGDHCSNYFGYTNPNVLTFSWIPNMDMKAKLWPELKKQMDETGPGKLQILDLPESLLEKLEASSYSEVMHTLGENDKLLKLMEAVRPTRTMIQTYQRDVSRKHPLLGMQHLVECISEGPTERRHYLCTLCNLTLSTHTIIKHVLSFDHIFCYLEAWHPSTLLSKGYYTNYVDSLPSMMLGYAKQSEEIHGAEKADMKQVSLEPGKFRLVKSACYAEVLKELESITKENTERSFVVTITPGKKLEQCTGSAKSAAVPAASSSARSVSLSASVLSTTVAAASSTTGAAASSTTGAAASSTTGTAASSTTGAETLSAETNAALAAAGTVASSGASPVAGATAKSPVFLRKVGCQACGINFLSIGSYFKHVSRWEHQQMMDKYFPGAGSANPKVMRPYLRLYRELTKNSDTNEPLIGIRLVVVCLSTQFQVEPVYVCFACEDCFSNRDVMRHFFSPKHIISTLRYQNPWRLPFGWKDELDMSNLKSQAWEEEMERAQGEIVIKMFDIPAGMLCSLQPNYSQVMMSLQMYVALLRRDVPQRETYKLKQNDKFPLLGDMFLVQYSVNIDHTRADAFLCLLCGKKLAYQEAYAHVFSWEHVATFLDCLHPGSVNASTDAETLMDLAKQAAHIHHVSKIQVINLDTPIREPLSYQRTTRILTAVKSKNGHGNLKPAIRPKKRLFPRKTSKDVDKGHTRRDSMKNSQMMEGSVKQTSQNAKKGDSMGPLTPNGKESEERMETSSKTGSEETKDAGPETRLEIKEKKKEEPIVRRPSGETQESCQDTCKTNGTEFGEENVNSSNNVLKQVMTENDGKRPSSIFENSQDGSNKEVENETANKRLRIIQQEAPCEEPHDPTCVEGKDVTTTDEQENGKQSHNTVKDGAIQTVKSLQDKQDHCDELPLTSSQSSLQPVATSTAPHSQPEVCFATDSHKVVNMEIGNDSDSEAEPASVTAAVPAMAETSSKTTQALIESVEDVKKSQEVSESVDAFTIPIVSRSSEDPSHLQVSASGANTTCLHHNTTGENVEAGIIADSVVGPLKTATSLRKVETSQNTPVSCSAVTTSTKSVTATSKHLAKSTSSTLDTSKSTLPVSSLTASTPKCTATSNTSKRGETASKCKVKTSSTTATNSKRTAANASGANSTATSKIKKLPKNPETVSQNLAVSESMGTTACENTDSTVETVHMKNSVQSDAADVAPKSKAPCSAAPHPPSHTSKSVMSENKNPPSEPSHKSASKAKPSEGPAKLGLNQMIIVTSEGQKQVYCQLCNVRVRERSVTVHLAGFDHQYSYLKMKLPGLTAQPDKLLSTFSEIVAGLAEDERAKGLQHAQTLQVTIDVFEELSHLPEDKALEKVKSMVRERNLLVSSPTTATVEFLRLQADSTSPCGDSSSDDEFQDGNPAVGQSVRAQSLKSSETEVNSVISDELQPCPTSVNKEPEPFAAPKIQGAHITVNIKQEAVEFAVEPQAVVDFTATDESPDFQDGNPAVGQSVRAQSLKKSETEVNSLISDELQPCPTSVNKEPEPIAAPKIQDTHITVNIKEEAVEFAVEPQAVVVFTAANESPADKMESDPPSTNSESAGRFAQSLDLCQKRSNPELQDHQKVLEGDEETSAETFFKPHLSAASVNTEQQNQSRPAQEAEHVPRRTGRSPQPGPHSPSQALTETSIGERILGSSHLSSYLRVKGLYNEQVVGLDAVWECRGISWSPFFLCELCEKRLPNSEICQHMISTPHQLKHTIRQFRRDIWFWLRSDLPEHTKLSVLKQVVKMLAKQERCRQTDAQVVLLRPNWYEHIQEAPFSEALELVQSIKREPVWSVFSPSVRPPQQNVEQPGDQQSREESLSTEKQSTQMLGTDQISGNETRQKPEILHSETAVVGEQRMDLDPLSISPVLAKAISVVCPSLQKTHRTEPELRLPVPQLQTCTPEFQVNLGEVHSASAPPCTVSPETGEGPSLLPIHDSLPSRKRPAVTSPQTLASLGSSNSQIEDPLPAKRACSQPSNELVSPSTSETISGASAPFTKDTDARLVESSPVIPTTTSTLLFPKDTRTSECTADNPTPTPTLLFSKDKDAKPFEPTTAKPEAVSDLLFPKDMSPKSFESTTVSPVATFAALFPKDTDTIPMETATTNPVATSTPLFLKDEDTKPLESTTVNLAAPFNLLFPKDKDSRPFESTPVMPAATSTTLCRRNEDAEFESDELDLPNSDWVELGEFIAYVRKKRFEDKSTFMLGPSNAGPTISCAGNSSESGTEKSSTSKKDSRCDSKCRLLKVTEKENLFSTQPLDGMFPPAAAPDNQLNNPDATSALSSANSSVADSLARGNFFLGDIKAEGSSTLPFAGTAIAQQSINAQTEDVIQIKPSPTHCVATGPGLIQQLLCYTDADSTVDPQLPINTIVTPRPKFVSSAAAYTTTDNHPVHIESLYQHRTYATSGFYLSQNYPEQGVSREMQQQQLLLQQQRQMLMQQQQEQQQQQQQQQMMMMMQQQQQQQQQFLSFYQVSKYP